MQQFQDGMAGFERFIEVMETEPEVEDKEDAIELKDVVGKVRFENVTFSYNDSGENVIKDINYTIESGKTVALVGPSGGGKTRARKNLHLLSFNFRNNERVFYSSFINELESLMNIGKTVNHAFKVGMNVDHKKFGSGIIKDIDEKK